MLDIKRNHVGVEPLPIAGWELLHILVPFARCDDRTIIAKEITAHMLTRRAVAQLDRTQRVLENLATDAHQGCRSFVP